MPKRVAVGRKSKMLFAHLKRIPRLTRLRLGGPNGASDEFLLAATAQNLRRLAPKADEYVSGSRVHVTPAKAAKSRQAVLLSRLRNDVRSLLTRKLDDFFNDICASETFERRLKSMLTGHCGA
jgi:hypothetical protein